MILIIIHVCLCGDYIKKKLRQNISEMLFFQNIVFVGKLKDWYCPFKQLSTKIIIICEKTDQIFFLYELENN